MKTLLYRDVRLRYDAIRPFFLNGIIGFICRAEPDAAENRKARLALLNFLKRYKAIVADSFYLINSNPDFRNHHFSYAYYLELINEAMDGRLYENACDYLGELLQSEPFLQTRIKDNLTRILEKYLI
jgi:hypothetical protein